MIICSHSWALPLPLVSLLVLLIFILLQLPLWAGSNPELYRACKQQFKCGNISAGYPFWGLGEGAQERPRMCGHPQLELHCDDHEKAPFLSMNGLIYRVLEINGARGAARIARQDTFNGVCSPDVRLNTTTTLLIPQALLSVVGSYLELTLLYGCPAAEAEKVSLWGRLLCDIDDYNEYCLVVQGGVSAGTCRGSTSVVVYGGFVGRWAEGVDVGELEVALRRGFEVEWKWGKKGCERCTDVRGGVCGFDESLNQTICYCPPPLRPTPDLATCTSSTPAPTTLMHTSSTRTGTPEGYHSHS